MPSVSLPVGSTLSCSVAITSSGIVPAPGAPYALSSTTVTDTPGDTKVTIYFYSSGFNYLNIFIKTTIYFGDYGH